MGLRMVNIDVDRLFGDPQCKALELASPAVRVRDPGDEVDVLEEPPVQAGNLLVGLAEVDGASERSIDIGCADEHGVLELVVIVLPPPRVVRGLEDLDLSSSDGISSEGGGDDLDRGVLTGQGVRWAGVDTHLEGRQLVASDSQP
jgi:hypothetical protein